MPAVGWREPSHMRQSVGGRHPLELAGRDLVSCFRNSPAFGRACGPLAALLVPYIPSGMRAPRALRSGRSHALGATATF
jgi:hypothetical protein